MRVLHVIGPVSTGGAQTQLLDLVRAAQGVHWDATIVATAGGPMSADFRALGVPYVELRRRGSPGLLRVGALRKVIAGGRFDVLNSHLWQANAHARLAVAGLPQRPAVVIVEHNLESERSFGRRRLDRFLKRWTDEYIAVTEAMADFVGRAHSVNPQALPRIPYAIDKAIFRPAPRAPSDILKVGSVGRLDPEKGFSVLLAAAQHLADQGHTLEVVIAGEGPLREKLEREARDLPVDFVGRIPPGEGVADFLNGLGVFVLPSLYREARPVVLLEALACGVPVVATDIPGIDETLGGGGLIVPPGDPVALAAGIQQVAADSDARARAAEAAASIPDFQQLAQMYSSVFRGVLDSRSAR